MKKEKFFTKMIPRGPDKFSPAVEKGPSFEWNLEKQLPGETWRELIRNLNYLWKERIYGEFLHRAAMLDSLVSSKEISEETRRNWRRDMDGLREMVEQN